MKIIKEEIVCGGKPFKVAYVKKYVLRRVSSDGLVKHDEDGSEYQTFNSEDEAFEFCANRRIEDVLILPIVQKDYLID